MRGLRVVVVRMVRHAIVSIKAAPVRWCTAALSTYVPPVFRRKLADNGLSGTIARENLVARLLRHSKCRALTSEPILSDNGVATLNTYSSLRTARGLGAIGTASQWCQISCLY